MKAKKDNNEEKDAGISGKTKRKENPWLVQKLQDCGRVPANQIVQITGQKKIAITELATTILFERNKWRIFHNLPSTTKDANNMQQKTS